MKQNTLTLKTADFGTVSHGTLRTEDLLSAFLKELEWQIRRNGLFLSMPENFPLRDKLNDLVGEAQDAWTENEDGETVLKNEKANREAAELVNELQDILSENFAPPYGYFGTHPGNGSDFGYWVDVESVKEQVEFVSSRSEEYPPAGFVGDWLSVNERGNCTLYSRDEKGIDSEIWGLV